MLREPAELRATLEAMGADRVRLLINTGALAWHLVVPAMAWLDEQPKDATHAPA